LSLVFALSARAQPIERAAGGTVVALTERETTAAFDAYQGQRFAEAVSLYVAAYAAVPNPDILYNIAQIYDTKLGDRRLAVSFYRKFIVAPDAAFERVRIAAQRVFDLRRAELAPPAAKPFSENRESEAPLAENRESEGAPPSAHWSVPEVLGVVTASAGIAAVAVGAGFGIAAMGRARTVHELCEGNICREERGIDATESARRQARWSTIGFISGSALLALGATSYFLLGGEARPSTQDSAACDVRISEHSGAWSLELSGHW
jgi:hypothetical protein